MPSVTMAEKLHLSAITTEKEPLRGMSNLSCNPLRQSNLRVHSVALVPVRGDTFRLYCWPFAASYYSVGVIKPSKSLSTS